MGLVYNYYRYYDPETVRYITSGPVGLCGGINTYSYVYNNPLKYIDPTGEVGIIGGGVGAVIGGISGVAGALVSGGDFESVLASGLVGAAAGAYLGATGGLGLGASGLLGSFSNLSGQLLTNNMDDNMCNNSDINWGSVAGSGLGGVWSSGVTRGMTGVAGAVSGGQISFQIETATTLLGGALWGE